MIVVRVELWPMGSEQHRRTIAEAEIENRGEAVGGFQYGVRLSEVGQPALSIRPLSWAGDVFMQNRRQSVWKLIGEAIHNASVIDEADADAPHRRPERHTLGLFLDVLPAAWGLAESDVEKLLDLPSEWLRAWRNHEVEIDDELASDILGLGSLQVGMRSVRAPSGYSNFWHHRWAVDSPIGARTPWQAFVEDGPSALDVVKRYLSSGFQ